MQLNQRRILLIEPPFYRLFKDTYSLDRYPLSMGYLAGVIKKKTDWGLMAYNADFSPQSDQICVSYLIGVGYRNYLNNLQDLSQGIWEEVRLTIAEYKPMVVGISAKTQNFVSARIVAKIAKEIDNRIIVIVGGPHPSMLGVDVLHYPEIDVGVRGEGENTIVELLHAIEDQDEFDAINGVVYRKNGHVVENAPRDFIQDLDVLGFPHENVAEILKNYKQYPVAAFSRIFATRGCPYNCLFCGSRNIWSRKVRFRSPENVVREIKGLQKMGLKSIHFDDDTFGVNKKYINDLCNAIITHCAGLKWSCELHVKLVDEQTILLMKKAGCYAIQIGIESGNDEMLKEIRKNITIEEALLACKIIKKCGLLLSVFFIVGFPKETEDTLNDTVIAMKKCQCDILVYSIFTPYPGTEIFEFCKEKGLIADGYDVSLYNHQSPANCFCINISPERFRQLVFKIERYVDRRNMLTNRIKRVFTVSTLKKIREIGIGKALRKGIGILTGK